MFPHGMISEEAMLAYLQNTLSEQDKQQFEKLLLEDPFAQEALEGLQTAQNIPSVTKSIASVKKNVRERSGAKETKIIQLHWTNYAWAAAVFGLLIGIGFLMLNYVGNKTESIAQNQDKTVDTETSLMEGNEDGPLFKSEAVDSVITEQPVEQADTVGYRTPVEEDKTAKDNSVLLTKKPEAGTDDKTVTATGAGKQGNEQVVSAPPVTTQNNQAAMTSEPAKKTAIKEEATNAKSQKKIEDVEVATMSEKKTVKKDKSAGTTVTMSDMNAASKNKDAGINEAMKNFNAGEYEKSGSQFSEVLKKDPNNADALYFGGISDYINNTNAKGEKNFDKLLKSGSRYTEGSKWYKANILIQKGKTTEAKKLLNDLANSNSSYKERAVKKLAEMEF